VSKPLDDPEAFAAVAAMDLEAAERLARDAPHLYQMALYHCQQAGEKWLKALLAASGVAYPRVHDLRALLTRCVALDSTLEALWTAAEVLTAFATEPRYAVLAVDEWHVIAALCSARQIRAAVVPVLHP